MVIIFICMIIGTFEAYNPVVRHEIITTKKITAPIRIVLVSDLHLGTFLGKEYCEKMVERINAETPDLILIAGDIVDDRYAIVKRQTSMEPLAKLKSKSGVAAVLGNHDYFDSRTDEEVGDLKNLGISVLINESKTFNEVYVVGLKDFSKDQSVDNLGNFALDHNNKYLILLDHQPRRIIEASDEGYDLYLAGHTHGGAFFPNELFTSIIHKLDYGRKNFSDMTAIVTSGYGFFGIPVRLGVNPEYVVIDLKP
ncbi:MAG: metallophosphoesterase [Acidaminococcaceae bacterium]